MSRCGAGYGGDGGMCWLLWLVLLVMVVVVLLLQFESKEIYVRLAVGGLKFSEGYSYGYGVMDSQKQKSL